MGHVVDREKPFYFLKSATALVQNGETIPYAPGTTNFHFEVELVVAIGGPAFRVAKEDALGAVYGYAVGLDMTRRDLQLSERAKQRPWDLGKDIEYGAPDRDDRSRRQDRPSDQSGDHAEAERRAEAELRHLRARLVRAGAHLAPLRLLSSRSRAT